jgi:glycosyltransferase involved in cell wall biosynthesis
MWLKNTVAAIIPTGANKNSIFNVIQGLDSTGYVDEIVVVDNGIDAETLKQINKTRARLIKQKKYGVGGAIKVGIKSTKADLAIITDPRGVYKEKDISKLLSYSDDFDTVFGSRTHVPLIGKRSGMTLSRRLIDDLFGKMISIFFLSSNFTDVGCTLRLTNRKGWQKVSSECKSNSEIFFTEWQIAAAKNKIKFIEVPVNFVAPETPEKYESFYYLALRGLTIFYLLIKIRLATALQVEKGISSS